MRRGDRVSRGGFTGRIRGRDGGVHTLLQLLDEVVDNLLERRAVDGELLLEVLNLLKEVLGDIGHGTWKGGERAIGLVIGIPRQRKGTAVEGSTLAGVGALGTESDHGDEMRGVGGMESSMERRGGIFEKKERRERKSGRWRREGGKRERRRRRRRRRREAEKPEKRGGKFDGRK